MQQIPTGPEWYPYDQGYFVADWLRAEIGAASRQAIDPEKLLRQWGVLIQSIKLSTNAVDAVASWGPTHGPVVILNTAGVHNRSREGMRATYAHEVAHLLLDRTTALPLAEVLGGRAVGNTEERARAFPRQMQDGPLAISCTARSLPNATARSRSTQTAPPAYLRGVSAQSATGRGNLPAGRGCVGC
jgi:hypothetical protein